MLQSEAGYIDARPHIRQLDEVLLQRTAGPYIGSDSVIRRCRFNVRFARRRTWLKGALAASRPGSARAQHRTTIRANRFA